MRPSFNKYSTKEKVFGAVVVVLIILFVAAGWHVYTHGYENDKQQVKQMFNKSVEKTKELGSGKK